MVRCNRQNAKSEQGAIQKNKRDMSFQIEIHSAILPKETVHNEKKERENAIIIQHPYHHRGQ